MSRIIFALTALSLVFLQEVCAQDSAQAIVLRAKTDIDQAYLLQQPGLLDRTIKSLDTIENAGSLQKMVHYYTGLAYFRMFPLPMNENSDLFSDNLDKAQIELEKAIKIDPDFDEAYALLGGIYGMKAAGMFSGIKYGKKAKGTMNKARELDSANPRTYLIDGIGDYYKPKLFGGGLDHALEAFLKAAALFESFESESETAPDWGKAETHAWLAQIYLDLGNKEKAEIHINKSIELYPDFVWVKQELAPRL